MKKRILAVLIAAVMTISSAIGAVSVSAAEEPVKGGTLTISLAASPGKLDPVLYTGVYEGQVIKQICDNLIEYNSDLSEFVPCLATEWSTPDEGKTYVFKIREGVKFHPGEYQDGRELTAEDVAYSLNRSATESTSNRLAMLEKAEVTGDYEVTCTLKTVDASFLTALTDAGNVIVPQEEVEGDRKSVV